MNYQLVDYQGNAISITSDKAHKIAEVAGLIEIEVNGKKHYINPSNIASIKPEIARTTYKTYKELGLPGL